MAKRVPASMRTRESLSDLIEGRLSSADGRAAAGKAGDPSDRRGGIGGREPGRPRPRLLRARRITGPGLAQRCAHGRLKTAEGLVDYAAPQIAGRDEPFRSEIRESLKGRTQALEDLAVEMLARGLSVRDIEDAFRDESGRLRRSASVCGRTTRSSPAVICRSTTSPTCSLTASPSASGPGRSASRFWRPGASRRAAPRCCCT